MGKNKRRAGPTLLTSQQGGALLAILALVGMAVAIFMVKGVTLAKRQSQTKNITPALAQAAEAIIGFAMAKGYLPCPAVPTIQTGTPNAGVAPTTCPGTNQAGVLPWITLGLPETDPWGRRYSYRVTASFADPRIANTTTPPANCTIQPPASNRLTAFPTFYSFADCSEGDLTILATMGGSPLATLLPAVIVSHGANGYNAFLPDGTRLGPSPDNDENENNLTNTTFIGKGPTDTFDDQVKEISLVRLQDMVENRVNQPR